MKPAIFGRRVGLFISGLAVLLSGLDAPCARQAEELLTVQLTFKPNGQFEPRQLEVPAGRFKIELRNESHEPVEFESLPLRKEKVLAPGANHLW